MASIYKPTYTKIDPKTGCRVKRKSRKWYIEYRDASGLLRRVPGHADKLATQAKAAAVEKRAARLQEGVIDPTDEQARRSLADHLAEFHRALLAKGASPKHANQTRTRVQGVLSGCGFVFIPDLSASRVQEFLADLREQGKTVGRLDAGKKEYTKGELAALLGVKRSSVHPLIRRHGLEAIGNGKARRYPPPSDG